MGDLTTKKANWYNARGNWRTGFLFQVSRFALGNRLTSLRILPSRFALTCTDPNYGPVVGAVCPVVAYIQPYLVRIICLNFVPRKKSRCQLKLCIDTIFISIDESRKFNQHREKINGSQIIFKSLLRYIVTLKGNVT